MALTLQQPNFTEPAGHNAAVSARTEPARLSPMMLGMVVMAVSILAVLALTMAMVLVLTDVSVLAAFGLGLYCAFWLGIGFGTIFGSAAVFGGADEH